MRAASLVSPNTGPVTASTTTDANGMWEFTGLADAAVDVKITYSGNVWWHKGLTKHSVSSIYYATPVVALDNFFRVPGFEVAAGGPWTATSTPQNGLFDAWTAVNGAGSSATISRETTTKSTDSFASAKIVQTKVAGSLGLYQALATPYAARGKEMVVTFQVHQSIANAVRAFISDSVGTSYGAYSTTTGSFVTITATRTIDNAATSVTAGITVDLSATVYVDNGAWTFGAVAPTYRASVLDGYLAQQYATVDQTAAPSGNANTILGLLNNIVNRINALAGTTNWYDAAASTIAALNTAVTSTLPASIALKVAKAGDTMTGALQMTAAIIMNNNVGYQARDTGGTARDMFKVTSSDVIEVGNQNFGIIRHLGFSNDALKYRFASGTGNGVDHTIFHAGMDGPGSGIDADLLDSQQGSYYQARANHTGTQAPATISPQGAGSGLDADTVDTYHAASLLARANHTGTQAPATISPQGTGSGLDADTVDTYHAASLLARGNHTGTQAPATISPQGSGSGLDADTVDGSHASAFATAGHGHTAMALVASGSYTGDGSASRVINIGAGFTPKFVVIQRTSAVNDMFFISGHDVMKIVSGGATGSGTGNALAFGSFTVTSAAGNNTGAATYNWVAFG